MLLGLREQLREGQGDAAEQIRREAAILDRARHPGVVPAHDVREEGSVVTLVRHVPEGPTLDVARLTLAETCGVFAVLATTVADLHHLDIATGALDASDVVLAQDGRPVIVTLARGVYPAGSARGDDVKTLGALLGTAIRSSTDADQGPGVTARRRGWGRQPSLQQALSRVAASGVEGRLTARQFAAALARPEATLPRHAPPPQPLEPSTSTAGERHTRRDDRSSAHGSDRLDGDDPREEATPFDCSADDDEGGGHAAQRAGTGPAAVSKARCDTRSPRRALRLGITVLCAAAGMLLVLTAIHQPSRPHVMAAAPSSPPPRLCVKLGAGGACRETASFVDGVLRAETGVFAVGRPGDVVATGRWACGTQPTLALLRPDRGEIWLFDGWPTNSLPLTARLAGRVAGAVGIAVEAEVACDHLIVTRSDGSRVPIPVGARR